MIRNYLDILAETIRTNWNQPALTDFYLTEDGSAQDTSRGNHYTYGEMYVEICRVAELLTSLGLQKGDHIAICGANSAHWAITYLAIAAYQGVTVTILHSQSIEDIARQIDFSDANAFFTDAELWEELRDLYLPHVKHVISLKDWQILRGKQIKNHKLKIINRDCQFSHGDIDDLAMICFTSGSTGVSKGVMIRNGSISNNVKETLVLYPKDSNSQYISFLPFAHMSGFMGDLLPQLVSGKNIHVLGDEFSLINIQKCLEICQPYMFIAVPKIYEALCLKCDSSFWPKLGTYCKLLCIGGSVLKKDLEDKLNESGIPVGLVYGLTETTAEICLTPYKQHHVYSCGRVVGGMEVRIAENGEILVKGENVMLGYYKDPEATARKIDKDGWLHTGDKGHLDEDGYLYVEGRLEQDMIVLPNGENIHPEDIERKINALPEVSESIVLARDGRLVAIVVPNYTIHHTPYTDDAALRRNILRTINPQLPLFSQLYDIEITDTPLQKTEKQTIKRYLYK